MMTAWSSLTDPLLPGKQHAGSHLFTHHELYDAWRAGTPYKLERRFAPKSSKSLKERVRQDRGGNCAHCGELVVLTTLDHRIPACFGGSPHIANLLIAHPHCNTKAFQTYYRALYDAAPLWVHPRQRTGFEHTSTIVPRVMKKISTGGRGA